MMFCSGGVQCWKLLGRHVCFQFIRRTWLKAVISAFSLALARSTQSMHGPDLKNNCNELLASTIWLYGLMFLFELRCFGWTGVRLLPIIKSMAPISGMLLIMFFLIFAFVHAFWAMDRENADG